MPLIFTTARDLLNEFDFHKLFVQQLGWSNPPSPQNHLWSTDHLLNFQHLWAPTRTRTESHRKRFGRRGKLTPPANSREMAPCRPASGGGNNPGIRHRTKRVRKSRSQADAPDI